MKEMTNVYKSLVGNLKEKSALRRIREGLSYIVTHVVK
jgi:hypothetical protein